MGYFDTIRHHNNETFINLDKKESKKGKANKWIKETNPPFYEFRLPPQRNNGVLRIDFSIEWYDIILISNAYLKGNVKDKQREKGGKDGEKRFERAEKNTRGSSKKNKRGKATFRT
ncbi:MAG: hypothetical protein ACE14O_06705 [Candidatus Cloacimonadaceae bacterium]